MKRFIKFFFVLWLPILGGCIEYNDVEPPNIRAYYIPVYAPEQEVMRVQVLPAQPLQNPGRIYVKDHLLVINERFKGYHIIDNSDLEHPKPLLFLSVPGAANLSMQGSYLYADNLTDLLTLDLSDLQNIREVNRLEGVLGELKNYPPFQDVGFECVDAARGVVVGWQEAPMPAGGPDCWR